MLIHPIQWTIANPVAQTSCPDQLPRQKKNSFCVSTGWAVELYTRLVVHRTSFLDSVTLKHFFFLHVYCADRFLRITSKVDYCLICYLLSILLLTVYRLLQIIMVSPGQKLGPCACCGDKGKDENLVWRIKTASFGTYCPRIKSLV